MTKDELVTVVMAWYDAELAMREAQVAEVFLTIVAAAEADIALMAAIEKYKAGL